LTVSDSVERFWRRGSTEIPIVDASLRGIPASYFFVRTMLLSESQSSYLQFGEGETTSSSNTAVILDGRASDDRSQLVNWSWRDGCSLCDTGVTTSQLAAGLQNVRTLSTASSVLCGAVLPGRSERGLVAANPCGNLLKISILFAPYDGELSIRLCGICWLCLIAIVSRRRQLCLSWRSLLDVEIKIQSVSRLEASRWSLRQDIT
jgi:hypothetical protein